MKKILSVFLSLCLLLLAFNFLQPLESNMIESDQVPILNMLSSSEFSIGLENENINIDETETYDICVLIEGREFLTNNNFQFDASTIAASDNVDVALKTHREYVKDFYTVYNDNIVSLLDLEQYDYYISYYSPYIEIVFDDIYEYEIGQEKIIESIANNNSVVSSVSTYATYDIPIDEATVDVELYTTNYLLTDAFDDIGVSSTDYTGNGVNVGIIDVGVPYITPNLKDGKYTMLSSVQDGHSTTIASIIGGNSGIAENVNFYCKAAGNSIINDCNLLINTYNVNIINASFGVGGYGYYISYESCIDNIISNTGCTFIKSAGNRGQDDYNYDRLVTAPGNALNSITVGAINYDKKVSHFSSWVVYNNFLLKPDVVAPGERLWDIPNIPNGDNGHNGTSYAAPMVVGTIALLMEEFPILKTNPALVKSVLHLGAEKLPSQTDYFDQQAGFGLVNYTRMRKWLTESKYFTFNIPTTASAGDIVSSRNVTVAYLKDMVVNANTIVNSNNTALSSSPTAPQYTNYSIKIFDLSTSTYVATSTVDSTVDYLMFTNNNQNNSSFRIDIVLEEDSVNNGTEAGAIAYEIHSYGRYIYHDNSSHIRLCSCGAYEKAGHYVRRQDIVNNRYATCMGCLAQLDLFEDNADIVLSITQVSINGSYVLPNGIVVLVDADIDAYLDGTLVFYHPDNIPVTQ